MFKIGLSREINKDSFNRNLNGLKFFISSYSYSYSLTGKFVKTPKESAIIDHMLLDGHKASFNNFPILLKESNPFKLRLKGSLLISRDKLILNKNICSFPLELFD